ncbi:60S ribosomal protein L35 [Physcia stellaris]|nr:60S ribosomal protein L35 [Physcia stellaris]
MSSSKVKPAQLKGKNKEDLKSQLVELKTELGSLRTQKIAGGAAAKLTKIHDLRKSIARVLTYINQQQRSQLRILYAKKKYLPLDLRAKKTRAIRRRLTKHEATRISEKQKKRQTHFPMRKYAVKLSPSSLPSPKGHIITHRNPLTPPSPSPHNATATPKTPTTPTNPAAKTPVALAAPPPVVEAVTADPAAAAIELVLVAALVASAVLELILVLPIPALLALTSLVTLSKAIAAVASPAKPVYVCK